MDLVNAARDLWRYRVLTLAVIAFALLGAFATQKKLAIWPPGVESKSIEYGAAQTQILIDSRNTPIVNLTKDFDPLVSRAEIYAQLMTSTPIRNAIGRAAGVPGSRIVTTSAVDPNQTSAAKEPTAGRRGNQILAETVPLRLFFETQPDQPIITISSQAPTGKQAVELADAAVLGFKRYIVVTQDEQKVPSNQRVVVSQLGPAVGGMVNEGANRAAAVLAFIALLAGGGILVLFIANLRRGMQEPIDSTVASWPHDATVLPSELDEHRSLQRSSRSGTHST